MNIRELMPIMKKYEKCPKCGFKINVDKNNKEVNL